MKHLRFKTPLPSVFFVFALFSCSSNKNFPSKDQTEKQVSLSTKNKAKDFSKIQGSQEFVAKDFAVSSQSLHSAKLAADAYEKSKNMVDAFVVMSFALAVERPQSTGIAGGGFLIFRHGPSGQIMAIDFREMAPRKAKSDMYVVDGEIKEERSRLGVQAAGVPGFVAGVLQAHMLFGKTPIRELLSPVSQLAREGFLVYEELADAIAESRTELERDADAKEVFFKNGRSLKKGDVLVQVKLADTIDQIAKNGRNGFYRGTVGDAIVQHQQSQGGIMDQQDLNAYQVKMREPVRTVIGDYQIYSMPPPSSGGTAVIQILNSLEAGEVSKSKENSFEQYHLMASAMQNAFADRAKHMGDPDYVPVPFVRLTSKKHAKEFLKNFDPTKAKASKDLDPELWSVINPQKAPQKESTETTHFSMIDNRGNMLASTQTINGFFGARVMVPGTGFFLNNQMNDFSVAAGIPNLYGAVGSKSNAIQGRKRPLSSMSPTLVTKKWKPFMALGSPSGTRIISCVANVIAERIFRDKDLYSSIVSTRIHHQWYPDQIRVEEPGFESKTRKELEKIGHTIHQEDLGCKVSAVERDDKILKAVVDPRGYGIPVGLGSVPDDSSKPTTDQSR